MAKVTDIRHKIKERDSEKLLDIKVWQCKNCQCQYFFLGLNKCVYCSGCESIITDLEVKKVCYHDSEK